jgi:dipeptidyl aminopeptidase/acylaminoacyl peptidase
MTWKPRPRLAAALLALLLALPAAVPAAAEAPPLTLEQIMADPDWIGNPPENAYWADDGRSVYYERERDGTGSNPRDLYRLDFATGRTVKVEPAERGKADAPGVRSLDRKRKAYVREGDVFVKDLGTGAVRQLTRTSEAESRPLFLTGGQRVAFRRGNSVFVYDLVSGLLAQAADLRLEKDPAEKDDPTLLAEQEVRLLDIVRQRQEKEKREREEQRANQKADPTRPPLPWYLGEDDTVEDLALSPSGGWLAVVTAPKLKDKDQKASKLPNYVTDSGNVETRDVRSKVGSEKPVRHSLVLLDLEGHKRYDVDLAVLPGIQDDPLKALREAAKAKREAAKKKSGSKDEADKKDGEDKKKDDETKDEKKKDEAKGRPVEIQGLSWSDDGQRLAAVVRARDNKDRWIATWDAAGQALTPRHRLTDGAWINWDFNDAGWLRDNETVWFLSEEGGYSRLYRVSARTGETRALTPEGHFEVSDPVQSWDGRYLYYTANAEHPGRYDVWRVEVATGKAEQLTHVGGLTRFGLSPDEGQILLTHSAVTRPNELYVQATRPGAEAKQVTNTRTELFLAQGWTMPEVVPVPSTHGATAPIWSRVYTPAGFDPAGKYPAVVFVHGAGYLQNVHYGWSSYFREFMFHTFLTRQGYVVLDMDYRASSGYGRDWRTAIYRQMGYPELEDLQDGVAWLATNKAVDPERVGVYGGSYGGFMTFMALFRAPDLFAAGAALRPVSDWAHYNDDYTSNILNRPEEDPEAYEKSSPIEYAAGLSKPLLICAPMQDQNVFFQDTVRLVQRLIELKKENFETAIFPVEDHGFVQPTSWLDEYRRIFKLFERYVK